MRKTIQGIAYVLRYPEREISRQARNNLIALIPMDFSLFKCKQYRFTGGRMIGKYTIRREKDLGSVANYNLSYFIAISRQKNPAEAFERMAASIKHATNGLRKNIR